MLHAPYIAYCVWMLFADQDLVHILFGMFLGGIDTAAVTLTWITLFLIRHPDIQEKVDLRVPCCYLNKY